MTSVAGTSSSAALRRTWGALHADAQREVSEALVEQLGIAALREVAPEIADVFERGHAQPSADANRPRAGTSTPSMGGRAHVGAVWSVRALPTSADLKRVDAMMIAALAGHEDVPSAPALLERALSRPTWCKEALTGVHALAHASLASTWRALVDTSRVEVTSAGGLGGAAVHVDTTGALSIDAAALARLDTHARRRVLLTALLHVTLVEGARAHGVQAGSSLASGRGGLADGIAAARAAAVAQAWLDPTGAPPSLEGKALYYPAGGHDTRSVDGVAVLAQDVGAAVSIDIAYQDAHALPVTPSLSLLATPGDALAEDVAAQVQARAGTTVGGVLLLAPGDFGALRRLGAFVSATLGALDVGGTLFNHHAWGYAPLLRHLPLETLGFTLRDVGGDVRNMQATVELVQKTRTVSPQTLRLVHHVDRLMGCYLERLHTGRFGQNIEDGVAPRRPYDARPPFLEELTALSRLLDELGDPRVASLVWRTLERASAQEGAQLTDQERCAIAVQVARTRAFGPVALTDTALDPRADKTHAEATSPVFAESPHKQASDAAHARAWLSRLAAQVDAPGTIGEQLASADAMLRYAVAPTSPDAIGARARLLVPLFVQRLDALTRTGSSAIWDDAGVRAATGALFALWVDGDADAARPLQDAFARARAALEARADAAARALAQRLDTTALEAEARAARRTQTSS